MAIEFFRSGKYGELGIDVGRVSIDNRLWKSIKFYIYTQLSQNVFYQSIVQQYQKKPGDADADELEEDFPVNVDSTLENEIKRILVGALRERAERDVKFRDALLETESRYIRYISDDFLLGRDLNFYGKALMDVRQELISARFAAQKTLDEETRRQKIYKAYIVYSNLEERIRAGEDPLTAFLDKSADEVLQELPELYQTAPTLQTVLEQYERGDLKSIRLLYDLSHKIAQVLRYYYLEEFQTQRRRNDYERLFADFTAYLIRKQGAELRKKALEEAKVVLVPRKLEGVDYKVQLEVETKTIEERLYAEAFRQFANILSLEPETGAYRERLERLYPDRAEYSALDEYKLRLWDLYRNNMLSSKFTTEFQKTLQGRAEVTSDELREAKAFDLEALEKRNDRTNLPPYVVLPSLQPVDVYPALTKTIPADLKPYLIFSPFYHTNVPFFSGNLFFPTIYHYYVWRALQLLPKIYVPERDGNDIQHLEQLQTSAIPSGSLKLLGPLDAYFLLLRENPKKLDVYTNTIRPLELGVVRETEPDPNTYFAMADFRGERDLKEILRLYILGSFRYSMLYYMRRGLDVKYESNRRILHLLVNTGEVPLVYTDRRNGILGVGPDGVGENQVGVYLEARRAQPDPNPIYLLPPFLTEEDLRDQDFRNLFGASDVLVDWAEGFLRNLGLIARFIVAKLQKRAYGTQNRLDEALLAEVLERFYPDCVSFFIKPKGAERKDKTEEETEAVVVPYLDQFGDAVRRTLSPSVSEKIKRFLWEKISSLLFYMIYYVYQKQPKPTLFDLERLVSPQPQKFLDGCPTDYIQGASAKENCILLAMMNLIYGLKQTEVPLTVIFNLAESVQFATNVLVGQPTEIGVAEEGDVTDEIENEPIAFLEDDEDENYDENYDEVNPDDLVFEAGGFAPTTNVQTQIPDEIYALFQQEKRQEVTSQLLQGTQTVLNIVYNPSNDWKYLEQAEERIRVFSSQKKF